MVNIAILKVDPRGRLSIPISFLKSNGINPSSGGCVAVMKPKHNSQDVVLEFIQQIDDVKPELRTDGNGSDLEISGMHDEECFLVTSQ